MCNRCVATNLMGRICSGERPSLRRRSSRSSCRIAFFCASLRAILMSGSGYWARRTCVSLRHAGLRKYLDPHL